MNQRLSTSDVRLRSDLQILRWRSKGISHRADRCVIHNPITGATVRVDQADLDRLRQGKVGATEPLATDAKAHELLANQAGDAIRRGGTKWWHNPLYIRLPGIPADGIAKVLANSSGLVFARAVVYGWMICFIGTAVLLIRHLPELWSSLPALASFQANQWQLALLVLASTKVLHELAHATVCRRMGAPCRQIGALLLCGTPCLYCDVSESWRIHASLKRAAVMMAGIYVELIIATLAAWFWLSSEPSASRMLALHIMMVCGISTVAFNINPLMRYDGYFVLSDLLNVTNLKQRASEAWNRSLFYPLVGIRSGRVSTTVFRDGMLWNVLLVAYHGLSSIYRYVVVAGLAGWMYYVTASCGLEPVGRAIVVVTVGAVVVGWGGRWMKMLLGQGIWRSVSTMRRILFAGTIVLLVCLLLLTPWNQRFLATGEVDYAATVNVYIPEDAEVISVLAEFGDSVEGGQPLLQLQSSELRLQLPEVGAQVRKLEHNLVSLKSRAALEPELLNQAKTTEAMLQAAVRRLQRLEQQVGGLTVRAPRAGKIVRSVPTPEPNDGNKLSTLNKLVTETGSHAEKGDLWCRIADENAKQITLSIDASQRAAIALDSIVRVAMPALASSETGGVIECRVADISTAKIDHSVESTVASNDRFEVTCLLPAEVAATIPIGSKVDGVFKGKETTLAKVISDRLLGAVR